MSVGNLVDRLAALPCLEGIPRAELEWLVAHGTFGVQEPGWVIGPKGVRIDKLWLLISGHVAIRVDRGAGPKLVTEWRAGDVTGKLPYSRMTAPPGDNYCVERTEYITLHEKHFPELVHRCPMFTAYTVHSMLDRARSFNTSALQDEKMVSLGKLAAGLAHELNNPASAAKRAASLLRQDLARLDGASLALSAPSLTAEMSEAIERACELCVTGPDSSAPSPLDQADREDEIAAWLARHQADPTHAESLAGTAVTPEALDALARTLSGPALDAAIRWLAARSAAYALAADIEQATTRIYELVSAVKRFTYMDNLAGPESVDVEAGIRDTMRVLDSKVTSKRAVVTLDVEADLPPARAGGGDLNQVWFGLIDNAIDAIPAGGSIDIRVRREVDGIVVRVVDDGPGIPPDVMPRIFDPFFTTKAPGQGTGLGLDMALRLVRRYHGDIAVDSRPGLTEFRVNLPAQNHGETS